jgi:hypothetical protein
MSKRILYHGSPNILEHPLFGKGKKYNDYGRGFYCTEHLELAKEWACNEGVDGYANRYEIETDGLSILNLSSDRYTILNWLAILLENRQGRLSSPIEKRGREYLLQNFLPEYDQYDVIIGYRADDSYFSFARSFVGNGISLKQLSYAMKLGKLGEQFVLKSEKAFDAIHFLDYIVADNSIYYAKRKIRDEEARDAFQKELENDDVNGIYMRDIIREEMKPDDVRLR